MSTTVLDAPSAKPNLAADLKSFLATCPKTGGGVHRWIFVTALRLHRAQVDKKEIAQLLEAASANCGRVLTPQEIPDAIANSERILSERGAENSAEYRTPKWPEQNQDRIRSIIKDGPGLDGLRALSPVVFNDGKPHADDVVDLLFPGNPLLCVGRSQYQFNTMARERCRGLLASLQFIVPSPMIQVYGLTKAGKRSAHTLANTGPRRFLVVEFDQGTFDQHAALLHHLGLFLPFVMAVHSGGKSLHGWFDCLGRDEKNNLRFMRYAVSLGADPATWIKSQFVRLPDGRRDNGERQFVIYFNPQIMEIK
jgi:hypothetical protein